MSSVSSEFSRPLARMIAAPRKPISASERSAHTNNYVDALAVGEGDIQVSSYQTSIDVIARRAGFAAASVGRYEEVKSDLELMIQGVSQVAFRRGFEAGRDFQQGGDV